MLLNVTRRVSFSVEATPDALPIVILRKNGALVTNPNPAPVVTALGENLYMVAFSLPEASWALGDDYILTFRALIEGVAKYAAISGVVRTLDDVNVTVEYTGGGLTSAQEATQNATNQRVTMALPAAAAGASGGLSLAGGAVALTTTERDAVATLIEGRLLNEGDGQMLINAIVGAIGNTNIDQAVLVAALRADMERAGGNLSTLLSRASEPRLSKLDGGALARTSELPVAPDNAGIAAIRLDYARRTNDYATPANLTAAQTALATAVGSPQQAGSAVTLPTGLATTNGLAAVQNTVLDAIGTRQAAGAVTLTPAERNAVADALLDRADGVETGLTVRSWLRAAFAPLLGRGGPTVSGSKFRNFSNTKDRVTVTHDALGNRTAVTIDLT